MVKALCLPILILLFILSPNKIVFANSSVAINEIFPNPAGDENIDEWVELYNSGLEDVDVNGWTLCDLSNHSLTISTENTTGATTILKSKSYLVVSRNNSSFSLNNSGDETVTLFNTSSCSGESQDAVSYNGTLEEKSWGRIPNGTGGLEKNLEKTPGAANIAPEPSIEPQNSPIESVSTTSTKKEKQASPKPSTTATSQKSPTPTPKTKSASVLGTKQQLSQQLLESATPSPQISPQPDKTPSESIKVAGILTGFGVLLIGASTVFYFWYYRVKGKRQLENKKTEIDENDST